MTTITVQVPDGNSCKGCDFKQFAAQEIGYNNWDEYEKCNIFNCRIVCNTKCFACRMLSKSSPEAMKEGVK